MENTNITKTKFLMSVSNKTTQFTYTHVTIRFTTKTALASNNNSSVYY